MNQEQLRSALGLFSIMPYPTSTITQQEKRHLSWIYAGITTAAPPAAIRIPGLEYSAIVNRLHYVANENRLHYKVTEEDR